MSSEFLQNFSVKTLCIQLKHNEYIDFAKRSEAISPDFS